MNRRSHRLSFGHWVMAALLPFITAGIEYLWLQATVPGPGCPSGPSYPTLPGLGVLILAVPLSISIYVRSVTGSFRRAWAPAVISTVMTIPVLVLVLMIWSAGQQCFE